MKLPFTRILIVVAMLACAAAPLRAENKPYKRTVESYSLPDVTLINQDGKKVRLQSIMQSDKLVVVDFIFGTCTTICPILSVGYSNLQRKLGPDTNKVHLISISIDPEHDTPKIMKEYLKRYQAKPGWDFLTGSRSDINKVMYALNAYIPNKMSHYPLTLFRPAGNNKWIRIFGLMNSTEFLEETKKAGLK
ncbi:SCO family protein [Pelotalea chapellei]|uniref:SCO family protein n=1 Tax=Pelotalea chapellei TaxID=44671 RepID=A0ABS5U5L0_9BACT|nr:SCO family protein [Pelotalea chapellei]MBT1070957.1 SCO family protein [Pelotalea chapellei]